MEAPEYSQEISGVLNKAALFTYLGIFCSLIGAGLGIPIPEELPILTAGVLVGHASEDTTPYDIAHDVVPVYVSGFSAAPGAAFPASLPLAAFEQMHEVKLPSPPIPVRWW